MKKIKYSKVYGQKCSQILKGDNVEMKYKTLCCCHSKSHWVEFDYCFNTVQITVQTTDKNNKKVKADVVIQDEKEKLMLATILLMGLNKKIVNIEGDNK